MAANTGSIGRDFRGKLRAVPALRYACAAIVMLAVVAFVLLISTVLLIPNAGVLYLLVVIASALWLGTGPAILALLIAVVAIAYMYTPIDDNLLVSGVRLVVIFTALVVGVVVARRVVYEKSRAVALTGEGEAERRRFQTVIENAPAGIALLRGPSFVIELHNPAYQAFAPGRKMLGKTVAEAWPERADKVVPVLDRVFRTGKPYHVSEMPMPMEREPDVGSVAYLTLSFVPMHDNKGAIDAILVLVVDATEHVLTRKKVEEERERAEQYAAEAEELAAEREEHLERLQELDRLKDDFLSTAAHELKTPLTSLRGFAQTLLRHQEKYGAAEPERLSKALSVIDQQSQKLARLVNQLLDVSSMQDGRLTLQLERVDLVRIVEEVAAAAGLLGTGHALRVEAPPHAEVLADPVRIEQVVANLVDNAIRYSPDGGPIEIEIAVRDGLAEIAVTDHGIGISPEKREHVFERFYRAHQGGEVSGLGLGLHISSQIAILHGGRIDVDCPPTGGTRFVVTLPGASLPASSGEREARSNLPRKVEG